YIYQADIVKGTEHFRTKVEKGLEIIQAIRGHISGLGVPHYVIDSPGGGGKIPLLPHYIQKMDNDEVVMKNYKGDTYVYPQVKDDTTLNGHGLNGHNRYTLGGEINDYF
ncbi:MAG: hypothetical protein HY22_13290, partial [[Candidatus Thermochlorobacteriaceae] bacterium GBChlB]